MPSSLLFLSVRIHLPLVVFSGTHISLITLDFPPQGVIARAFPTGHLGMGGRGETGVSHHIWRFLVALSSDGCMEFCLVSSIEVIQESVLR
ncbi:hypothetical protein CI102_14669 [Trichoderma harzianum]|nr:hypothetical protein CI102_14669 [Trichoderma harzianum]